MTFIAETIIGVRPAPPSCRLTVRPDPRESEVARKPSILRDLCVSPLHRHAATVTTGDREC